MASTSGVVVSLMQAVANTYTLTALTQNAHWNVSGPDFFQLHGAFGSQYESLFDTIDLLAERVRALGSNVPVSLSSFESLAAMPSISSLASARGMVEVLVQAHLKNVSDLQGLCETAKAAGDDTTENMALSLIEAEQKTLWMLKSYLGV